jgi:nucleotide-binding universal stress UspA family protein
VSAHVVQGDAVQAILAEAGDTVPVVMATHGRTGLTRLALGSGADRVAHGGIAAVLLARVAASHARG